MRRPALILIALILLGFAARCASRFLAQDDCLDLGGAWNAASAICSGGLMQ